MDRYNTSAVTGSGQFGTQDEACGARITDLDGAINRVESINRGISEMVQRLMRVAEKLGGPQGEKGAANSPTPPQMPGTLRKLNRHIDDAEAGLVNLHALISRFQETL